MPNGNACAPVHRWFHLKEAFSSDLLKQVVADTRLEDRSTLRVLDPFAGAGTTAVSLANLTAQRALRRVTFYGFECQPHSSSLWGRRNSQPCKHPQKLSGDSQGRSRPRAYRGKVQAPPVPDLSTFRNDSYFDRKDLDLLLRLRAAIDLEASAGAKQGDVSLARLCLAATVEPVSSLRRDGRALRYVPAKVRARPICNFLVRAERVEMDMACRTSSRSGPNPSRGRARRCAVSLLVPRLTSSSSRLRIRTTLITQKCTRWRRGYWGCSRMPRPSCRNG